MSGEMSGHLFRLTGLETDIICTDTRIFNSYKRAGNVQRLGSRGDVDETASGLSYLGIISDLSAITSQYLNTEV